MTIRLFIIDLDLFRFHVSIAPCRQHEATAITFRSNAERRNSRSVLDPRSRVSRLARTLAQRSPHQISKRHHHPFGSFLDWAAFDFMMRAPCETLTADHGPLIIDY